MNIENYKTILLAYFTDPEIKSFQKDEIAEKFAMEQAEEVFRELIDEEIITIDDSGMIELTEIGRIESRKERDRFLHHIWSVPNESGGSIDDFYNALDRLSQFFFEDTETLEMWFNKKWSFRSTLLDNGSAPFKGALAFNVFQDMEIQGRCFIENTIEENGEKKTYSTYAFNPRCRVVFHDKKGEILLTPRDKITTEYEKIVGDKIVSVKSLNAEDQYEEMPFENGVYKLPVEHCTLWYWLDSVTFDVVWFYAVLEINVQTKIGQVIIYRPLSVYLT